MEERYEQFTVLIGKINRSIRKIKVQEMAEYDLKSIHVSCLYYLYTGGPSTSTELCEQCNEDKAAVSRSISYLQKCGYIACAPKSAKRYRSPLELTDEGRRVGAVLVEKIGSVMSHVEDSMSEEERLSFYRSLSTLSERLQEIAQRPKSE